MTRAVSPFLCRFVRVAMLILEKQGRVNQVLKHLGSPLDEVGVVLLLENSRQELYARQLEFDLFDNGSLGTVRGITLAKSSVLFSGFSRRLPGCGMGTC